MKVGYIGKQEFNLIEQNKPFKVHPKETKAKTTKVYIRQDIGIALEQMMKVAKATGIANKLSLHDLDMLQAYTITILKMDRQ